LELKILQVVAYYPPALSFGGPPQVNFDLGRELMRRGHSVTVYTTDVLSLDDWSARTEKANEKMDGVEVHRFGRSRYNHILPTKYLKLLPSRIPPRYLEDIGNYDIIHISEVTHHLAVKFSSRANGAGVPYVVSIFGNLTPDGNPVKQTLKAVFMSLYGKRVLGKASSLLVQTPHEGEACSRYVPGDKVDTMLLPVDISLFQDLPERGEFREKHGIGENEKVILFLGRIHRNKGIQFLLKSAAGLIRTDKDDYRLVIAGTDEGYKASLVGQAERLGVADGVIFTGSLFGRDKLEAYVDADVFAITPNAYEETSLAALEACACGTPVIVTERNAVPGLEDYQAGFHVHHNNQAELENTLMMLLANDDFRMKMGDNARRMIETEYALGKVVDKLEALFLKVAGEK
jgi:glycosyltransferase involved in cell wall biosynthesis